MQTFQIRNEPQAMSRVTATEFVTLIAVSNTVQPLTTDETLSFQRLWLYPIKSFSAGVPTANAGNVRVGKSATYLPDLLAPTDGPVLYELPLGQKMKLADVNVRGTATDGIFVSFT